jgi:hypothetical protein
MLTGGDEEVKPITETEAIIEKVEEKSKKVEKEKIAKNTKTIK